MPVVVAGPFWPLSVKAVCMCANPSGYTAPPAVPSTPGSKKKNKKKKTNGSNNTTTIAAAAAAANKPEPVAVDALGNDGAGSPEVEDEVDETLDSVCIPTHTSHVSSRAAWFPASPRPMLTPSHVAQKQDDEPETPTEPASKPIASADPDSKSGKKGHAGTNGHTPTTIATTPIPDTAGAKLEAMSQDREALRAEVEQLRKQLESIQENHESEVSQLRTDLEESEAAKEEAETQYQTLLNRVEKIKETLGDRLKRDKAELEEAKDRVEELEAQTDELQRAARERDDEADRLRAEAQEQARELASLRSRNNLSQQNWLKERDDMARQLQALRAELETTSGAMGEWEVIALEERSVRESLAEKVTDLEEQLANAREAYDKAAAERDTQSQVVDGLQRALQELQEARKRELRERVESSEQQLQAMKAQVKEADARASEAEAARESLSKELERTAPFEKEVKEKNLLIGKLRHEAIVLNDHLTKALKYIKKTKPEETIDRYNPPPLLNPRHPKLTHPTDKSSPTTSSNSSPSTAPTPASSRSSKSSPASSTGPTSSASRPASRAPAPSAAPCACRPRRSTARLVRLRSTPSSLPTPPRRRRPAPPPPRSRWRTCGRGSWSGASRRGRRRQGRIV